MRFEEYYQTYLSKHQHPMNRMMHAIGNILTIAYVIGVIMTPVSLWWLLLAPAVVYPPAVLGHILFENSISQDGHPRAGGHPKPQNKERYSSNLSCIV